jgi:pimeloyl-ACP methyl ester carboxylesterase
MLPVSVRLAEHFAVGVPDLPGFGRSESPPRALGVGGLADALIHWCEAVGMRQPLVLANSLGCQVAIEATLRTPGWCCGLVLVAPTIDPDARTVTRQLARWLLNAPREPWSEAPIVARDYLQAGPGRLWRTLKAALEDRPEDKLARIEVPVLVMRGQHDPIVPPAWARRAARLAPQGELSTVAGAAHTPHFSHPAEVAAAVVEFATRHGLRAGGQAAGVV